MKDRAVLNFANQHYIKYQRRLRESLERVGCHDIMFWTDELPPESPSHAEASYAFKLYALKAAEKAGAKMALWLDSGFYAIRPLGPIWETIEAEGVYFVRDDQSLAKYCSDEALAYFGKTRAQAADLRLISGGIMGFKFDNLVAQQILSAWWQAYAAGLYRGTVSKHSGQEDHRGDESILGMLTSLHGVRVHTLADHFSADGDPQPTTIFQSGYRDREVIAEHTVMIPPTGPVLDVGARSFAFSRALAKRGLHVVAMEPDPTVRDPQIPGVEFIPCALAAKAEPEAPFVMDADPQARRLGAQGTVRVPVLDIQSVMRRTGINHWGVVKLDCEGAEFEILKAWPGPIADLLTIEWHEHTPARRGDAAIAEVLAHMEKWYRVVQHEKSERHATHANYWDSVLVLRQ